MIIVKNQNLGMPKIIALEQQDGNKTVAKWELFKSDIAILSLATQQLELLSILALWTKPQTNNPKSRL